MSKTAVILFNLGGPDQPAAVKPFLFNLFNDPAIIRLPQPWRWLIAKLISGRRDKVAQAIYAKIGGGSPILPNTERQAQALEQALSGAGETRCFVAMRCWHPFVAATVAQVKAFQPDRIVLLPLYPQYSTTTSASSLGSWHKAARNLGMAIPTQTLCCYPAELGFIAALARRVQTAYDAAKAYGVPRVLFSSHGLPASIVKGGDPYQWQAERTAAALVAALNIPNLDAVTCYQSRVGPMQWITPATDAEILNAARAKRPIVIVPIAFVSEHSETLVEIDMEYRELALHNGAPFFAYSGTVADDAVFINGLAATVRQLLAGVASCAAAGGGRLCPPEFTGCCFNQKELTHAV